MMLIMTRSNSSEPVVTPGPILKLKLTCGLKDAKKLTIVWMKVLVLWVTLTIIVEAAVPRKDGLYGPRYQPLWKEGTKTNFTKFFGPSSIKYLIENNGFLYENYTVTTDDGYLINLNRIVHPDHVDKKDKGFPLLLLNGFIMHSDSWMVQGEMDSNLAFVWAALGYDVWLGDHRGTVRSRGHINMTSESTNQKYWDHSMEEIGIYDAKAFVDFVLDKTGYKQLNLMCVSMGCSFHAVLASTRPEYNEKILGAFYFVPLVNNINRYLDTPAILQLLIGGMEMAATSYEEHGLYETFPRMVGVKKEFFYSCLPFANTIVALFKLAFRGNIHLPKGSTLCYQLGLSIGGASTKTAKQIVQLYREGYFAKYDYGRKRNMELYGEEAPPMYNMSKITSFVAMYYSDSDGFSTIEGAKTVFDTLGGPTYECMIPSFSHFDLGAGTLTKHVLPDINAVLNSLTGYSDDKEKYKSSKCPSMEWIRYLD